MRLVVGCGEKPTEGAVNMDIRPLPGVVVHDCNTYPWPFQDNTFEHILAERAIDV